MTTGHEETGEKGLRVQGDMVEGDGTMRREMNMCFPWVPYHIGREGGTGKRGIYEFRAREEAVMMRSNTWHVTQDGLDAGDCSCEFLHTQQKVV